MSSDSDSIVDISIAPDPTASERLQEISNLPGFSKVVGLNDLYQGKQETPTSIVTATQGTVYPELSSNVLNCGISLIKTGLRTEDVTPELISEFRDELPHHADAYRPTKGEIFPMLQRGAEFVIDRWATDSDVLENIENGGNMFDDGEGPERLRDIVPPWLLWYGGVYEKTPLPSLRSNHFIEFQAVDEVLDEGAAKEWGISDDEVVIMLHGDYALTFMISWHHANRLKFREHISVPDRAKMQLSKAAFHLYRGGVRNFRRNWRLYDNRGRYTGFNVDSGEGQHLATAIYAAMNFAYANRLMSALAIRNTLWNVTSNESETELLWDVGHDTIQRETVDGEEYWLHRKGAAKSVPGKPALVAGSYNMNSFLGKCEPESESFLFSYDHGSSNVLEHFQSDRDLGNVDEHTMMFDLNSESPPDQVRHVEPRPIETLVENLTDNDVVSKVAWLRPIANISEQ